VIEVRIVDQWLYQTLTQDATLASLVGTRVYSHLAPLGAAYPLIIFAPQSAVDVAGLGTNRVITSLVYQIKAVGTGGSFAAIEPILDRVDTILQNPPGVPGTIHGLLREGLFSLVEVDGGTEYRHLGGLWRILTRKE